jgi:hypothetical protein
VGACIALDPATPLPAGLGQRVRHRSHCRRWRAASPCGSSRQHRNAEGWALPSLLELISPRMSLEKLAPRKHPYPESIPRFSAKKFNRPSGLKMAVRMAAPTQASVSCWSPKIGPLSYLSELSFIRSKLSLHPAFGELQR